MTPKEAREQQRQSQVVWFEIPASDLDRATRFYETILGTSLPRATMGPEEMALFPYEPPAIGGCIVKGEAFAAGSGTVVYLNADPSLDAVLGRVEAAGGAVVVPRTALPEGMGFFARIRDTEGNTVGLHAVS